MRKRLHSLLLVFVLVLGMLPASAYAADVPFTVTVNGTEITDIVVSTLEWKDLTCYTVTVPEGSTEATLKFEEKKQWSYYDSNGTYLGAGDTSWTADTSHTVAIADQYGPDPTGGYDTSTPDGVLDGISVQIPDAYSTEYFIQFVYGSGESGDPEVSDPFLNIKIGGVELAKENIAYKGIFELGDYAADEQQDVGDSYDYVHQVPYYHVTVPCGTASVDVTYSGDTNIMNYGSDAYGYKTDLEVDAVSSATVRGTTFKNAYTKNGDGTQTVKTPVTGYTFDADGNGHAITLEEDGGSYAAVCLFSFEYDGVKHVYDSGVVTTEPGCESEGVKTFTCSCGESYTEPIDATGHSYADGSCSVCGAADPNFAVAIPDGMNIKSITAVTSFEDGKVISYYQWGSPAGEANSYIATVPEGTETVTVTFKAGTHPDPYTRGDVQKLSGAHVYPDFNEMGEEIYNAGSKELTAVQTDGLYSVEMNVADFLLSDNSYYGAYDSSYAVQYLLAFKYPEGAHEHSYTEEVTTEPGCVTEGVKTFTCSCGDSYTEEIPATGHKYGDWQTVTAATCAAAGEKQRVCTNGCAEGTEGRVETQTIAKTSHTYGEPVEDPKATCTAAGTKTYTCTVCPEGTEGHTKTETVPALGHNYENGMCKNGCGATCPLQDENGVFQIGTYADLLWFANAVNGGDTAISGALTANITVEEDWPGIGNYSNRFAGSFDGQNYTVTLSGGTWGLFGYTMGTHKDHNLKDAAIIQNVILEGTVQNSALIQNAGYTHISGCINRADVTGGNSNVAGIVGTVSGSNKYGQTYSDVLIQNCGNEGDIQGDSMVGGILGYTQANTRLDGCYNTGAISGNAEVGGLVGYMQGSSKASSVKNSYNKGTVTGDTFTGGILGQQYNGVSVANVYNAGASAYAISGRVYNKTASASNIYYRSDLSTYGEPEYFQGSTGASNGFNNTVRGEAVNSANMGSAEFAATLGDAFQESCGGPVLTWQNTVEHSISENRVCTVCHYGLTEATTLKVHKSTGDGYTIAGGDTVTKGMSYTFTVEIEDGYEAPNLAVYYNGTSLTADENGQYTVIPTGHFYITVTGVTALPDAFGIILPKDGDGYRVKACEGYSSPVAKGEDYKFTVEIVDGFKEGETFEVRVNNAAVDPENGVYTISNVQEKKTITVHDVVTASTDSVTIDVHITDGPYAFFEAKNFNKTLMINQSVTVPYFDLELYGLEKYYYNPYCYVDANGNPVTQTAGTREQANGVVTVMHAFIYMTDMFYLGLDEEYAGTGYSDRIDTDGNGTSEFDEAICWALQPVGSTFITNFWGHEKGGNLNYHVNYKYPLGRPNWGSTSDQIAMNTGDVLTLHFIEGAANGSAFGFFAADDTDNTYDGNEQKDYATVKAGETITLTNYIGSQGPNYTTAFITGANKELYWVEAGAESAVVAVGEDGNWSREGFGNMTAEQFKTDENGVVTLDTTGMKPGTYYIANHGQFYKGNGTADSAGFVSNGAEAGPSYFVLTIEPGATAQITYGDVNGDGEVLPNDAMLILQFAGGDIKSFPVQGNE